MKKKVLPAKMVLQASSSYPTRRPARPKTSPRPIARTPNKSTRYRPNKSKFQ